MPKALVNCGKPYPFNINNAVNFEKRRGGLEIFYSALNFLSENHKKPVGEKLFSLQRLYSSHTRKGLFVSTGIKILESWDDARIKPKFYKEFSSVLMRFKERVCSHDELLANLLEEHRIKFLCGLEVTELPETKVDYEYLKKQLKVVNQLPENFNLLWRDNTLGRNKEYILYYRSMMEEILMKNPLQVSLANFYTNENELSFSNDTLFENYINSFQTGSELCPLLLDDDKLIISQVGNVTTEVVIVVTDDFELMSRVTLIGYTMGKIILSLPPSYYVNELTYYKAISWITKSYTVFLDTAQVNRLKKLKRGLSKGIVRNVSYNEPYHLTIDIIPDGMKSYFQCYYLDTEGKVDRMKVTSSGPHIIFKSCMVLGKISL